MAASNNPWEWMCVLLSSFQPNDHVTLDDCTYRQFNSHCHSFTVSLIFYTMATDKGNDFGGNADWKENSGDGLQPRQGLLDGIVIAALKKACSCCAGRCASPMPNRERGGVATALRSPAIGRGRLRAVEKTANRDRKACVCSAYRVPLHWKKGNKRCRVNDVDRE